MRASGGLFDKKEEIRALINVSDVIRPHTPLSRAGHELVGLCIAHSERSPSMRVNDALGTVYCFGCGFSGDVFQVIQQLHGCTFTEALAFAAGGNFPAVDPADRIRRRQEDAAVRARDIADAVYWWGECVDPVDTPAEVYARQARGITMPLPPSIRFGNVPPWRDRETGDWVAPRPAMVCAVYDRTGDVVGIQRIFLRDGGRAKANMRRPKLTLGRIKGASLRLGPVQRRIILCESPEDGLSLAQEIPGSSVWPSLGTGLMPAVEFPEEVEEITIAGQNDAAGREAVRKSAEELASRDYSVSTMFPDPRFADWNDELRGIAR